MERTPKSGEFYRHFKDKLYQIVTVAEHTETGEVLVVYQALYGEYKIYARPLTMFLSEVDHQKYPAVTQKYRFENVTPQNMAHQRADQNREADQNRGADQNRVADQSRVADQNREADQNRGAAARRGNTPEPDASPQAALNSNLLAFIEAEAYGERMECLCRMKGKVCQADLDIICVALDMGRPSGTLEEQLHAVEQCLKMQQYYDGGRLR